MNDDIYNEPNDRMGVTDIRMICKDENVKNVINPNSSPKYEICQKPIF